MKIQGSLLKEVLFKPVKYLQACEKAPPRFVAAPTKEMVSLMHVF
jgi:hypothetical protein